MNTAAAPTWRSMLIALFHRREARRWDRATQVTRFAVAREAPQPNTGTDNIFRSPTSKVGKSRFGEPPAKRKGPPQGASSFAQERPQGYW